MDQFEIAFGRCTVRDDFLRIDRSDPEQMGRWEIVRTEVSMSLAHRPWITTAWIGVMLVFVALLAFLYTSNPAVAPLVAGLGVFGLCVVGGALEVNYRRQLRERRKRQRLLADEFSLARPSQISLDAITGVTVRPVSTRRFLSDGWVALVHFQHDGEEATTPLGFPTVMDEQLDTARTLFKQHDIPVTDTE